MGQPIPEWWCQAVVKALESYDSHIIDWTPQAFQRWNADSSGGIRGEAYPAVIDALSVPGVLGNETTPEAGQKAVYEFLFRYRPVGGDQSKLMYGKIALLDDSVRILILSAHNSKRITL